MQYTSLIEKILLRPIPSQQTALVRKQSYRSHPLLLNDRSDEPLVDISLYGIAGQSYYSRPNNATGDAVPDIAKPIFVRQSIAERLAAINYSLQINEVIEQIFGRPVELYIDEGLRPTTEQARLYDDVFPQLIRKLHSSYSPEEVLKRRDELIASPATDDMTPTPHSTGAALDVRLRYADADLGYVPKSLLPMGQGIDSSAPDYYERQKNLTAAHETIRNRRVLYWVMRGALLDDDSGFICNPTEWWHWSHGDQLWAALTEAPAAFFGASE